METRCANCNRSLKLNSALGTKNRNHCPFCLYSLHVDSNTGDRKADCNGLMEPTALTFKNKKSGEKGEIMLVHKCKKCGKVNINRLAGDDRVSEVMDIFVKSLNLSEEEINLLVAQNIVPAKAIDKEEVKTQLFGK